MLAGVLVWLHAIAVGFDGVMAVLGAFGIAEGVGGLVDVDRAGLSLALLGLVLLAAATGLGVVGAGLLKRRGWARLIAIPIFALLAVVTLVAVGTEAELVGNRLVGLVIGLAQVAVVAGLVVPSASEDYRRAAAARQATPGALIAPPAWRDERVLRMAAQVVFLAGVAGTLWYLARNLVANMRAQGMRTDFGFLEQPAAFAISGAQDFSSRDSIWQALLVGFGNTLRVAIAGVVLATILGVIIGIARLSTNWLVRKSAAGFVEALRNVPLLVFLFFVYLAVLQQLPPIARAIDAPGLVLSNRGVWVPWLEAREGAGTFLPVIVVALVVAVAVAAWRTVRFNATGQPHHRALWALGVFLGVTLVAWALMGRPLELTLPVRDERVVVGGYRMTVEMGALVIGLVLYMAAFIAEIVRGSILSVPKGQTEAANAVGLTSVQRLRYVILPQALRVAIPPTGNEYLNTSKNTALGVLIAFPETLRVARIAIGNGHPAPQLLGIMMAYFLLLSLVIAVLTNVANWLVQRRGRR